jgi:transposase-like protein
MFVGTGTPRKPEERARTRELRRQGMSIKRIAAKLDVSPSSVFNWTRDIELTPEQHALNLGRGVTVENRDLVSRRAWAWSEVSRAKRRAYQAQGRSRAKQGDPLHLAGCMLYWAEGAKSRNTALLANSDVEMVRLFKRFLTQCFDLQPKDLSMRLNVYTGNGLSVKQIEDYWLDALDLPRSCLRKHTLNHFPTSSSGLKKNKLPYGVCGLRVLRSTRIVQHIYGAIQEYAGFEEPRWLDGRPRKPAVASAKK